VDAPPASPALRLTSVDVIRPPTTVLAGIDWTVDRGQRWIVLGPNGAGKTTLLRLAALYLHPSRGEVEVLGHRLGRVDVGRPPPRLGLGSPAVAPNRRADRTPRAAGI
jgi:iron complex transport system ATP-binding protein